jgi:hypothetical protein
MEQRKRTNIRILKWFGISAGVIFGLFFYPGDNRGLY